MATKKSTDTDPGLRDKLAPADREAVRELFGEIESDAGELLGLMAALELQSEYMLYFDNVTEEDLPGLGNAIAAIVLAARARIDEINKRAGKGALALSRTLVPA